MKKKKYILIIVAYETEIMPFLNKYSKSNEFKKINKNSNFSLFEYNNFLICISNIGQLNAAFTLVNIFNQYSILKIYNIGFCGSLENYFSINDVVFANYCYFLNVDLTYFKYKFGQLPNYPRKYRALEPNKNIINNFQINSVNVLTSNNFIYNIDQLKEIKNIQLTDKYVFDMETTALMHICYKLKFKNIIILKVISDLISLDNNKKNIYSLSNNVLKCSKTISKILEFIIHKS